MSLIKYFILAFVVIIYNMIGCRVTMFWTDDVPYPQVMVCCDHGILVTCQSLTHLFANATM